jgi:putative transposase
MKRHCITELMYHLVLTAKYRRSFWIPDDIIMKAINSAKMAVHEWVNDKDHLHLLIEVSPTISISKSIEIFKTQTSRLMLQNYWRDWDRWSRGYHISTVGAEKDVVEEYIRRHFK